jgi:gas vesicle protein
MTNVQFYFALGLPILSILIVWLGTTIVNTRAIAALGQRIEDQGRNLAQRIEDQGRNLAQRIEDQGKNLAQRIEDQGKSLTQRIDDLRAEMRAGFESVNGRLDRLEVRFDRIEDEVRKDHESRLSRLEARVFSGAV